MLCGIPLPPLPTFSRDDGHTQLPNGVAKDVQSSKAAEATLLRRPPMETLAAFISTPQTSICLFRSTLNSLAQLSVILFVCWMGLVLVCTRAHVCVCVVCMCAPYIFNFCTYMFFFKFGVLECTQTMLSTYSGCSPEFAAHTKRGSPALCERIHSKRPEEALRRLRLLRYEN